MGYRRCSIWNTDRQDWQSQVHVFNNRYLFNRHCAVRWFFQYLVVSRVPFCIFIRNWWRMGRWCKPCVRPPPPLQPPNSSSYRSARSETLPFTKRVLGGVLLYTAAPIGALLGWFVNFIIQLSLPAAVAASGSDNLAWRIVFASAIIPTIITLFVRRAVKEPESWVRQRFSASSASVESEPTEISQIFGPEYRKRTVGSIVLAVLCLSAWWICSTFLPVARFHDALLRT